MIPNNNRKRHHLTSSQSLGLASFAYSYSYLVRNPNQVYITSTSAHHPAIN